MPKDNRETPKSENEKLLEGVQLMNVVEETRSIIQEHLTSMILKTVVC